MLVNLADVNVARGTDALTLLDNVETRNTVVDELMEVSPSLTAQYGSTTLMSVKLCVRLQTVNFVTILNERLTLLGQLGCCLL